ncbi:MAG TPA: GlsB/YeaQ/YmgE family stress response membrane protein [Roseiarcus sp.]|nr:GlsB/YeaQ/YmgE family stress response membrane protein [Roseiarcus sp.]
MVSFIVWLIVGGIAGWLAGQLFRGAGFGLIGNILLGVVGSLVAGFLLPRLGVVIGGGFIADVVDAAIGSIIVLAIASFFRRA